MRSWQINVADEEQIIKAVKRGRRSTKCSASVVSGSPAPTSSGRSDKLTQNSFSPIALRLANASKALVRERIGLSDGFPGDRDSFIWETIQLVAKDIGAFREVLKSAEADVSLQDDLIEFVRTSYPLRVTSNA